MVGCTFGWISRQVYTHNSFKYRLGNTQMNPPYTGMRLAELVPQLAGKPLQTSLQAMHTLSA